MPLESAEDVRENAGDIETAAALRPTPATAVGPEDAPAALTLSRPPASKPAREPPRPAADPDPAVASFPTPGADAVSRLAAGAVTPVPAPGEPGAGAAATAAGAAVDAWDGYAARLLTWLEAHKEYPRRARLRGQEGTVSLYVVIDRRGRLLDWRIEHSSGHDVLDREAIAMFERAQPLPRFPESLPGREVEFVVPISFVLR